MAPTQRDVGVVSGCTGEGVASCVLAATFGARAPSRLAAVGGARLATGVLRASVFVTRGVTWCGRVDEPICQKGNRSRAIRHPPAIGVAGTVVGVSEHEDGED